MTVFSGSILVVDDQFDSVNILRGYLEKEGHTIYGAYTAEQALSVLEENSVDLVLLDIVLPGMNGIELLKKFKEHKQLQSIPVIVLSALEDTDSVVRCIELGADDYITKPYNLFLLKARINASLEKKWLREQDQERLLYEKQQTEAVLLQTEKRLQAVIDSAPVVLFAVDHRGVLTTLEGQGFGEFDAVMDLLGKSVFDFFEEDPVIIDIARRALGGELIETTLELENRIWEVRISPVEDEKGQIITVIGVAIDVTQGKKTEIERERLYQALEESHQGLQALSARLVDVQEMERRAIATELHDEIGQSLTGLKLALDLGLREVETENIHLGEARKLAREVLSLVREMSLKLRPTMLDDLGLVPTLEWHFSRYEAQTNIKIKFEHDSVDDRRFEQQVETAIYRITQEALTNVARYAGVTQAFVKLWHEGTSMFLEIIDEGAGFFPQIALKANVSSGLTGMQDRVNLLDGKFEIESKPGAGTRLYAVLPGSPLPDKEIEIEV